MEGHKLKTQTTTVAVISLLFFILILSLASATTFTSCTVEGIDEAGQRLTIHTLKGDTWTLPVAHGSWSQIWKPCGSRPAQPRVNQADYRTVFDLSRRRHATRNSFGSRVALASGTTTHAAHIVVGSFRSSSIKKETRDQASVTEGAMVAVAFTITTPDTHEIIRDVSECIAGDGQMIPALQKELRRAPHHDPPRTPLEPKSYWRYCIDPSVCVHT